MRASQSSSSSGAHSARFSSPWVTLSQASPQALRGAWCTASRMDSVLSDSSSLSVNVPGVTTRTTLRSTGPLLVATSPTCSQIATDSPCLMRRAR
jgi:CCR4-NOT transcriptional regulation complex NOT5 subunit